MGGEHRSHDDLLFLLRKLLPGKLQVRSPAECRAICFVPITIGPTLQEHQARVRVCVREHTRALLGIYVWQKVAAVERGGC